MKNCLEMSDKLIQDIMKSSLEKKNPRLDLVIQENNRGESYSIHYASKSLIVKAESPQTAVFAVNQQEIAGGYSWIPGEERSTSRGRTREHSI